MVGVDTALTPFPEMRSQTEKIQYQLNTVVVSEVCVTSLGAFTEITVGLENLSAGHSFPSGATQDRRVGVELVAYDEQDRVLYQSGVVSEGQPLTELEDPDLWRLGDRIYDAEGQETHMFWEAASYESDLLLAPTSNDPTDPAYTDVHRTRQYTLEIPAPARVTLRVRLRPMGLDILNDLVASGDLDAAIPEQIVTYELLASNVEWRADLGLLCVPDFH